MKTSLAFAFLMLTVQGYCQFATLNGHVVSEVSNKAPVESVIIMDARNKKFADTDSFGNFTIDSLHINQTYNFKVLAFGYNIINQSIEIKKPTETIEIRLATECSFDSAKAITDIENDEIKLLLIGSIAPVANSKRDRAFEKKYNIEYYDFGCSPPAMECILSYNQLIFVFLDKKFGAIWRLTTRKDIIGLKY